MAASISEKVIDDPISETTSTKEEAVRVNTTSESRENVSDAYRAEFLATFTPDEEKKIMRKVDYRILVLFGLIYMCKQVRTHVCIIRLNSLLTGE